MADEFVKEITKKSQDFSAWYSDVVLKAQLAEYAPVRGCMIIRPYGYALWERIQAQLDPIIKNAGVQNAYFPLFIPESFIKKEKKHVEGFSPEMAVVTIGGGEKLAEPLIVRPTSETIMYATFAKWIFSWRDLPLKINQWCNVVRWEKRPYLFLRTTEFLWQEGHTAHASHEEAMEEVLRALNTYEHFYTDFLSMPGYAGVKSQGEKFAGADNTYTYEMLMPDGKVLQGCTSHDLGQNFSKVFEIDYLDSKGTQQYVWQTSWGLSTRSIGGLIMVHGDDRGLRLPPKVAPIQVVIVPIYTDKDSANVRLYSHEVRKQVDGGFRVHLDDREDQTPGWKFNDWELKGVPIRLEVGPRELTNGTVILVRRDTGDRLTVIKDKVPQEVGKMLVEIQNNLLDMARGFLKEHTFEVETYGEFKEIMATKKGFIKAFWCENENCEEKIKQETKATSRCLPLNSEEELGVCIYCGKKVTHRWLFGQSY